MCLRRIARVRLGVIYRGGLSECQKYRIIIPRVRALASFARVRAKFTTRGYRGLERTLDRDGLSSILRTGIDPVSRVILQPVSLSLSRRNPRDRRCRAAKYVPPFIYFLFNFASLFRVSSRIGANVAKVALFSLSLFFFLF